MILTDCATAEGTSRYRARFPAVGAGHFRNTLNIWLSSIGIGTYLGNADDSTDQRYTDAVAAAVELGINVIDSAANYRFQRSERSIGQALQTLTQKAGFARDEIIVCTKGGYLPFDGAPPRDVRRYIEETFVRPGIAAFVDIVGGSHCMTPAYLESQLQQSLKNLGLNCIDLYYIHNPESQLGYVSQDEFYRRLRAAFEFLEQSINAGKIRNYGVASWNGFRVPETSREYHSLARMVDEARAVAGDKHGFRFIQLPYNLAMPEAFTLANQRVGDKTLSILEAAVEFGITVVASASILQGRVARGLPPDLREHLGPVATDAQAAIQFVRSTPGVTTALIGMSTREHVVENVELASIEPLPSETVMSLFSDEDRDDRTTL